MALAAVHDDGEVNQNTVFIDTSLDTHLATIVSDSDTVSDLKQKIMLEHRQCYPDIGDIRIECLKVKRRGIFYRLSDSMPIKSAFRAAKRNWYVSVDVSRLERDDGTQHIDRHTVGDQLALPWVTDSRSIDRHDSHADRHLKLSLAHISILTHPKEAPFVNQKVPIVDQLTSGDSCKDLTKKIEDDRSYNDDDWRNPLPDSEKRVDSKVHEQPYAVNEEINSKKRTLEMHNESLLSGSGPSMKKKHKTQKVEGNVNVSQENIVLTFDSDKVQYTGASISNENSFKHKSKSKDLGDENTTINKGKNFSALDQVATAVPSSVEDVGEETCPRKNTEASVNVSDVAMVVDNNILQDMPVGTSQKEKDNELVHRAVMELPSSPMRTSDCELGAPGITGVGHLKGSKHKAAEKEVSSTSSIKKLNNVKADANDSSQQDVGSIGQQSAGNQINKHKKDKGDGKRKKSKKSVAKDKDESLVKNADNIVGDMSSAVPVPVFDEKINDQRNNDNVSLSTAERNEVSEKTVIGDHLVSSTCLIDKAHNINKDAIDTSQKDVGPTVQESAGDQIDKHKEARGEGKKRKSKRSAAKNKDESLVKHAVKIVGDMSSTVPAPVFDEKIIDEKNDDRFGLSNAERNDVSEKTCKDGSLAIAAKESDVAVKVVEISKPIESVVEKSVKESNNIKRSRKKKKDESLVKHVNNFVGDMSSTVPAPVFDERNDDKVGLSNGEMNEVLEKTFKDDSLVKSAKKSDVAVEVVEISKPTETVEESSMIEVKDIGRSRKKKKDVGKSALRNDESVVKPKDVATVTNEENVLPLSERKGSIEMTSINALHVERGTNDDILINNDVRILGTEKRASQVNVEGVNDYLEKPNEKMDDGTKKSRKKKVAKKSAGRNENESSKHQSTELKIGPDKVKSVELHCLPEEASKNVNVSEVSKVGMEGKHDAINELDIPKDKSHEIDFKNYFVSGHQPNKIAYSENGKDSAQSGRQNKPKKKTKEPPLVETPVDNKRNRKRDDIATQSQKSCLINENSKVSIDVAKESKIPNIDLVKTPTRTRKIETNKGHNGPSAESSSSSESFGRSFHNRKSNKELLVSGQTQVKTVKKNPLVVNSSQNVKSLLNTPGTIFGNDTDESAADDNAAVNSDLSTRTPSRNALSSSGESASSIDSRKGSRAVKRKEGGGKNSISSQSRSKNISMFDLLRSSSRFKRAKLTASEQVEDTESQPVDFVPESQPI